MINLPENSNFAPKCERAQMINSKWRTVYKVTNHASYTGSWPSTPISFSRPAWLVRVVCNINRYGNEQDNIAEARHTKCQAVHNLRLNHCSKRGKSLFKLERAAIASSNYIHKITNALCITHSHTGY